MRERLFWLQACWATKLSPAIAWEADRFRKLFHDLSDELRKLDADALDTLIAGYKALLLAEPTTKPAIPLAAQRWHELGGEVRSLGHVQPKPDGYIPDGLRSLV